MKRPFVQIASLGNVTGTNQGLAAGTAGHRRKLVGFSMLESAGATAVVTLHHGTSTSGDVIARVALAANESTREWWGGGQLGVDVPSGVFVDTNTSPSSGAAYVSLFYTSEP